MDPLALNALSKELLLYRMAEKTPDEIRAMSYSLDELMIRCSYEDVKCEDAQWSEVIHPTFGMCYAFNNFQRNKSVTHRPGPEGGLVVELNLMTETYTSLTTSVGARITIETSEVYPFPEIRGMKTSPGLGYEFTMTHASQLKLQQPYGNCVEFPKAMVDEDYYYNGIYSLTGCDLTNLQRSTIKDCNCCNPNYAKFNNCSICKFEDQCHRQKEKNFTKLPSQCYQSCRVEQYHSAISQSTRPIYCAGCEDYGVLRISVFYIQLFYVENAETPAMLITDLVSMMGNYMGLLLGMSVISTLELCLVMVDAIRAKLNI